MFSEIHESALRELGALLEIDEDVKLADGGVHFFELNVGDEPGSWELKCSGKDVVRRHDLR